MSNISIEMKVPLDINGFLRRECPTCERQFKQKHSDLEADVSTNIVAESYFCPYCYQPAPENSWWTKGQIEYAQQLAFKEILEPELQSLQRQIQSLNHQDSLVQVDSTLVGIPEPTVLHEADDMIGVTFPCHPEESLKIDESWDQDVACLVCGIQYPVSLVKELPE